MCVFRFKMWWMTRRMGTAGQEIPFGTQFLIVEGQEGSHFGEDGGGQSATYVVFLPILEGDFRAVLQGNANDELEISLESGMDFALDYHPEIFVSYCVVVVCSLKANNVMLKFRPLLSNFFLIFGVQTWH